MARVKRGVTSHAKHKKTLPVIYALEHAGPEDRERMRDEFPRLLHPEGGEFRSEFRIVHPLLGVRWILSLGRIVAEIDPRQIKSHDELAHYYFA